MFFKNLKKIIGGWEGGVFKKHWTFWPNPAAMLKKWQKEILLLYFTPKENKRQIMQIIGHNLPMRWTLKKKKTREWSKRNKISSQNWAKKVNQNWVKRGSILHLQALKKIKTLSSGKLLYLQKLVADLPYQNRFLTLCQVTGHCIKGHRGRIKKRRRHGSTPLSWSWIPLMKNILNNFIEGNHNPNRRACTANTRTNSHK